MFYKWSKRDFDTVLAGKLVEGDEMALGNTIDGSKYGIITVERVMIDSYMVLIWYTLPVGAVARSSEHCGVSVEWRGAVPVIQISQDFNIYDPVLARKKR